MSYGISITTLEEVFLKINQEFKQEMGIKEEVPDVVLEDKVNEMDEKVLGEEPSKLHETYASLNNELLDANIERQETARTSINRAVSPKITDMV